MNSDGSLRTKPAAHRAIQGSHGTEPGIQESDEWLQLGPGCE